MLLAMIVLSIGIIKALKIYLADVLDWERDDGLSPCPSSFHFLDLVSYLFSLHLYSALDLFLVSLKCQIRQMVSHDRNWQTHYHCTGR